MMITDDQINAAIARNIDDIQKDMRNLTEHCSELQPGILAEHLERLFDVLRQHELFGVIPKICVMESRETKDEWLRIELNILPVKTYIGYINHKDREETDVSDDNCNNHSKEDPRAQLLLAALNAMAKATNDKKTPSSNKSKLNRIRKWLRI